MARPSPPSPTRARARARARAWGAPMRGVPRCWSHAVGSALTSPARARPPRARVRVRVRAKTALADRAATPVVGDGRRLLVAIRSLTPRAASSRERAPGSTITLKGVALTPRDTRLFGRYASSECAPLRRCAPGSPRSRPLAGRAIGRGRAWPRPRARRARRARALRRGDRRRAPCARCTARDRRSARACRAARPRDRARACARS